MQVLSYVLSYVCDKNGQWKDEPNAQMDILIIL